VTSLAEYWPKLGYALIHADLNIVDMLCSLHVNYLMRYTSIILNLFCYCISYSIKKILMYYFTLLIPNSQYLSNCTVNLNGFAVEDNTKLVYILKNLLHIVDKIVGFTIGIINCVNFFVITVGVTLILYHFNSCHPFFCRLCRAAHFLIFMGTSLA
jgi:hypothetical protein